LNWCAILELVRTYFAACGGKIFWLDADTKTSQMVENDENDSPIDKKYSDSRNIKNSVQREYYRISER